MAAAEQFKAIGIQMTVEGTSWEVLDVHQPHPGAVPLHGGAGGAVPLAQLPVPVSGAFSRIGRPFLRYLVKTAFLLLAVSIIAFALVSASPVDPVQQYVLGVGGVSPEQRLELEAYWGVNQKVGTLLRM